MKKLICVLFLIMYSFSYSYAGTLNISEINTKIMSSYAENKAFGNKILILEKEKKLIEIKYKNAIIKTKASTELQQQRSALEFQKLGLGSSSAIIAEGERIEKEGKYNIQVLENELVNELLEIDNEIKEIGNDITLNKKLIKELSNDKKNLKSKEQELEKSQKTYNKNIELGDKYYNIDNYNKSLKYYQNACNTNDDISDKYTCNYKIGLSYIGLEKHTNAKQYFYKSIDNTESYEKKSLAEDQIEIIKKQLSKTDDELLNDKLEKQAEKIFKKFESKFKDTDIEKKNLIYKTVINKLDIYTKKSKNIQLVTLIKILRNKLYKSIYSNENFDDEVYKIISN